MILWFLMFVCCASALSVDDELFCKDPDTGEYHAANSTWSSTSFCGNYTCKIRPKHKATTEYIPTMNDKVSKEAKANKLVDKIKDAINEEREVSKQKLKNNICASCNEINTGDRYLNKEEVTSLAKFLYSVKKSDLDELVKVYNLVKDMYGEMDTAATEIVPEKISVEDYKESSKQNYMPHPWYNPMYLPYWNAYYSHYPHFNPYIGYSNQPRNPQLAQNNQQSGQEYVTLVDHSQKYKPVVNDGQIHYSNSYSSYPISKFHHFSGNLKEQTDTRNYKPNLQQMSYPKFIYVLPSSHQNGASNKTSTYPYDTNAYDQTYQQINIGYNPSRSPSNLATPLQYLSNPNALPAKNAVINEVPKNVCPWKTPPLSENMLDEVRAHVNQKKPSSLFKPKPIENKMSSPMKKIRLERIGKVLRLDELKRKTREAKNDNKSDEAVIIRGDIETIESNKKEIINEMKVEEGSTETINIDNSVTGKDLLVKTINIDNSVTGKDLLVKKEKEVEKAKENILTEIRQVGKDIEDFVKISNDRKQQENESNETYIVIERCNLESEPGYFRTGDLSLPFPQCCPQRIQDGPEQ